MDEESKKLLKEEVELNKENNQLLNKLVSYQRWTRWLNISKWVIVVGATLGAIYYIQPLIDRLWNTYAEIVGTISNTSINTLSGNYD